MISSDEEQGLIERAKEGDKQAFNQLVAQYDARVKKIISRYIYDQAEVNDLAQETFLKMYRSLSKFRGDSAFYTWLYRVAINTAKNYTVYCKRHTPLTDIDYETAQAFDKSVLRENESPERKLIRDQAKEHIQHVIEDMPEDLRVALLLRDIESLCYEDIADVMDCPVGTVRSRIFRAREFLNEHL